MTPLPSSIHLGRPMRQPEPRETAPSLLRGAARIVLGGDKPAGVPVAPIAPAANAFFGPRGVCFASETGPFIVCDTGHHRLLVWKEVPSVDHAPADFVIGQPDFATEGRNANGEISPSSLNVPVGVASDGQVLAVADSWNHRVLLWHEFPRVTNRPADVVIGQLDFRSGKPNRGEPNPTAESLNWCYGVAIAGRRLFVADTGNRRVLVWHSMPTSNGAPADLVLGQPDFTSRDESAGGRVGAAGMRWPHALAVLQDKLFVADAGLSRVMAWNQLPAVNGRGCDFVLGQADFGGADHNRASDRPSASSLNMPHGLAVAGNRLVVADTANSRLLGFDLRRLDMGSSADGLAGQSSFAGKGENRWRPASRDSLCWPYGIAAGGRTLAIADSGNNRVIVWETA